MRVPIVMPAASMRAADGDTSVGSGVAKGWALNTFAAVFSGLRDSMGTISTPCAQPVSARLSARQRRATLFMPYTSIRGSNSLPPNHSTGARLYATAAWAWRPPFL